MTPVRNKRVEVKYSGVVVGRAVEGEVKRETQGSLKSLLGDATSSVPLVAFVCEDGDVIQVMEDVHAAKPVVYSLRRSHAV